MVIVIGKYGSILDHNYTVKEGSKTIVKVHKNRLTIKDAYFIDIDEDCDDKAISHDDRYRAR